MGDDQLDAAVNALRKLRNGHLVDANKPELYMYKEYHVEAFHDSEIRITRNILVKVRNNLISALNKYPGVLPHYLIIIMANHYMHDDVFVDFEFKNILKRIFNDIGRLLAIRREQLPIKIFKLATPTEVYITRPLPKPAAALKTDPKFKNARRAVNQMLDNLSLTLDFKPLNIDAINCAQKALFNRKGDLSDYGKERMWQSISEFIKFKDRKLASRFYKSSLTTEDIGTQYNDQDYQKGETSTAPKSAPERERNSSRPYDSYRTRRTTPTSQHQAQPSGRFSRGRPYTDDFDEYHCRYDTQGYEGYHQHDERDQYYYY